MFAAVNIKLIVIALVNFGRAAERGETFPVIVVAMLAVVATMVVFALFCLGRSVQAWERQQVALNTALPDEIDAWESHWEHQEARYIASLTGADYLEATGVYLDAGADHYSDDRGTEQERLLAEVRQGKVPQIFHPCGWCRRCALHDDPGGCLTVEEYERDFPEVAAACIAMVNERSA